MKTLYFTAVLTITCLLGLSAHARDVRGVVVNIPFQFVAGGATLPAGEYGVNRVNTGVDRELEIHSCNNAERFCSLCSRIESPVGSQSLVLST